MALDCVASGCRICTLESLCSRTGFGTTANELERVSMFYVTHLALQRRRKKLSYENRKLCYAKIDKLHTPTKTPTPQLHLPLKQPPNVVHINANQHCWITVALSTETAAQSIEPHSSAHSDVARCTHINFVCHAIHHSVRGTAALRAALQLAAVALLASHRHHHAATT